MARKVQVLLCVPGAEPRRSRAPGTAWRTLLHPSRDRGVGSLLAGQAVPWWLVWSLGAFPLSELLPGPCSRQGPKCAWCWHGKVLEMVLCFHTSAIGCPCKLTSKSFSSGVRNSPVLCAFKPERERSLCCHAVT